MPMQRSYRMTCEAPSLDAATLPEALRALPTRSYRLGELDTVAITFAEADFPLIPAARAWMRAQDGATLLEQGLRHHDPADVARAPLAQLSGGELQGVAPTAARVFETAPCTGCGLPVRTLDPHPVLDLPSLPEAGLFRLAEAGVFVASAQLVRAAGAASLAGGLETFPVTVGGRDTGELLGLLSSAPLGQPAAPYGRTGTPCPVCQRNAVRLRHAFDRTVYPGFPRFAFYHTFEHASAADWTWTALHDPGTLVVSRRLHEWLITDGSVIIGESMGERGEFAFYAYGWYPDEKETAFLDESLQQ